MMVLGSRYSKQLTRKQYACGMCRVGIELSDIKYNVIITSAVYIH